MDEKILAQGEPSNLKWLKILIVSVLIIGLSLCAMWFFKDYNRYAGSCPCIKCEYYPKGYKGYECPFYAGNGSYSYYDSAMEATKKNPIYQDNIGPGLTITSTIVLVLVVINFWLANNMIVVTDKRVYGRAAFGRRVDLPLDKISAIGMNMFKGIAVGTSSGSIKFLMIKNRDEVHSVISQLIIDRQTQNTPASSPAIQQVIKSDADELKKYKELLDSGVISQEEFDAKKKQLLGL